MFAMASCWVMGRMTRRHARGKAVGRNIPRYHAARANHAALAHRHARAHHHVGAKPAVAANFHGLCIAQKARFAVCAHKAAPLARQHGVQRRDNGDVGPKIAMAANGNRRVVLHGEIAVHKAAAAHAGVAAVVEPDGPQHQRALAHLAQQLAQNGLPGLLVLFIQRVEGPA